VNFFYVVLKLIELDSSRIKQIQRPDPFLQCHADHPNSAYCQDDGTGNEEGKPASSSLAVHPLPKTSIHKVKFDLPESDFNIKGVT